MKSLYDFVAPRFLAIYAIVMLGLIGCLVSPAFAAGPGMDNLVGMSSTVDSRDGSRMQFLLTSLNVRKCPGDGNVAILTRAIPDPETPDQITLFCWLPAYNAEGKPGIRIYPFDKDPATDPNAFTLKLDEFSQPGITRRPDAI